MTNGMKLRVRTNLSVPHTASQPADARRDDADDHRCQQAVGDAVADQLRHLEHDRPARDGDHHQEAEPGGGVAVEAASIGRP